MKLSEFSGILREGGTILGTSRQPFKRMRDIEEKNMDKLTMMITNYQKEGFDALVILGGNGTHKTAYALSQNGVNVVTLPKTIDNDLFGTDHCPGFGSAAKFVATSVAEVYKDAHVYDTGTITIIEVMGRNAGWLTGSSALAGLAGVAPDFIYLPEITFDPEKFLNDVESVYKSSKNCLVAVSEGVRFADGSFVSEGITSATDGFGHAQLGGTATRLAAAVKERTGAKIRAIELSLLQRCAAHLASQTDIDEAYLAGKSAVKCALAGETGKMVAFTRYNVNGRYECGITYQPLAISANVEKTVPRDWITKSGTYVTQEFIDYVLPLIQGENRRELENGLPRFAKLKKIPVGK
jgi:6-phosphofructokinase 1